MTVYFARATVLDHIKIGYVQEEDAALAPAAIAARLVQVGRLVGSPMELLASTPGKRRVERWYHLRHAVSAIGGEWFYPSPDLDADVALLRSGRRHADTPAPLPYPHYQNYRWWQIVARPDGSTFWAERAVKPYQLRKAARDCVRAA